MSSTDVIVAAMKEAVETRGKFIQKKFKVRVERVMHEWMIGKIAKCPYTEDTLCLDF
jgi:hypothetical protein